MSANIAARVSVLAFVCAVQMSIQATSVPAADSGNCGLPVYHKVIRAFADQIAGKTLSVYSSVDASDTVIWAMWVKLDQAPNLRKGLSLSCAADKQTIIHLEVKDLSLTFQWKFDGKCKMVQANGFREKTGRITRISFIGDTAVEKVAIALDKKNIAFDNKNCEYQVAAIERVLVKMRGDENLVGKLYAALFKSINKAVCRPTTVRNVERLFKAMTNFWQDAMTFKYDKYSPNAKIVDGLVSLRYKIDKPLNHDAVILANLDCVKQGFNSFRVLQSNNVALIIEAKVKNCPANYAAKTGAIKLSVDPYTDDDVLTAKAVEANPKKGPASSSCAFLMEQIHLQAVDAFADAVDNKLTHLLYSCPDDGPQKQLEAGLDKMFQDGFTFDDGAGKATFPGGLTTSATLVVRCSKGKILALAPLTEIPLNMTLTLPPSCPDAKEQTASTQFPIFVIVGNHVTGLDGSIRTMNIKSPAAPATAVPSDPCTSLESRMSTTVALSFREHLRDIVLSGIYPDAWQPCPADFVVKFVAEFAPTPVSDPPPPPPSPGGKHADSPLPPADASQQSRRRRQASDKTSVSIVGFKGITSDSHLYGCSKESKLVYFVTEEDSQPVEVTAEGTVTTTCPVLEQKPCDGLPYEHCNEPCIRQMTAKRKRCIGRTEYTKKLCNVKGPDCCACPTIETQWCHTGDPKYQETVWPKFSRCASRDASLKVPVPVDTKSEPRKMSGPVNVLFGFNAVISKDITVEESRVYTNVTKPYANDEGGCKPSFTEAAGAVFQAAIDARLAAIFSKYT